MVRLELRMKEERMGAMKTSGFTGGPLLLGWAGLLCLVVWAGPGFAGADEAGAPFWKTDVMRGESLLFVREADAAQAEATCLFPVQRIIAVQDVARGVAFEAGRDFTVGADRRTISLPEGSRIPQMSRSGLYVAKGAADGIPHKLGSPEVALLFGRLTGFIERQVEVTYERAPTPWTGYRPQRPAGALARVRKRLAAGQPVTIALTGDSISAGYNASQVVDLPPRRKPYIQRVGSGLRARTASPVRICNHAIGGWTAKTGLQYAYKVANCNPDLVVIAFGMNDLRYNNPQRFAGFLREIMQAVARDCPEAEFLLVSSMPGNPEWHQTPLDRMLAYRAALLDLAADKIAVADMTQLWLDIMKRKKWLDLTGNGVNHPNDFGQSLYAQVILSLLLDDTTE